MKRWLGSTEGKKNSEGHAYGPTQGAGAAGAKLEFGWRAAWNGGYSETWGRGVASQESTPGERDSVRAWPSSAGDQVRRLCGKIVLVTVKQASS